MSRLNYILSRHRTQSPKFAYMINSWYACLEDVGDLLDPNYFSTLKAGGRERERERERLKRVHTVSVLKSFSCASAFARQTILMLSMLSIACPNV